MILVRLESLETSEGPPGGCYECYVASKRLVAGRGKAESSPAFCRRASVALILVRKFECRYAAGLHVD